MSKKLTKLLSTLLVALFVIGMAVVPVFASADMSWDDIKITSNTTSATAQATENITGTILGVVQVIGVAVAIIMLVVLAIKYISAAPNDKAEIKKHAVVYIVGAVVLFAASGIIGLLRGFGATVSNAINSTQTGPNT